MNSGAMVYLVIVTAAIRALSDNSILVDKMVTVE